MPPYRREKPRGGCTGARRGRRERLYSFCTKRARPPAPNVASIRKVKYKPDIQF